MSWDKYRICRNCGYREVSMTNHANIFGFVCPKCGGCSWECEIIGREIFIGKWYNPATWFNSKFERKESKQ